MQQQSSELLTGLRQAITERRYEDAIREARRFFLSGGSDPEVQRLLGEALLASQRLEEARVELLALLRMQPRNAKAHRLLGEAYLRSDEPVLALKHLRMALELDPLDPLVRSLLEEAENRDKQLGLSVPASKLEAPTMEVSFFELTDSFGLPRGNDDPADSTILPSLPPQSTDPLFEPNEITVPFDLKKEAQGLN
ncbi:MAG: tetratricopeptide repeat protein, partial [Sandaracinaceae bacterium]|nr:tetratricopeptide repeat protein [Sandaracinaceae bacterium]